MKNILKSLLLVLIIVIGFCSTVSAQRFAVANGNWTDPIWATTSGGVAGSAATPTSSDAVTINVGRTVTINTAASCASFVMTGASSSASTVSISGSNSLNCVGAFTMSLPSTNTTNTFAVAAGTLTVGGTTTLSATTNTAAAVTKISLTTGTINFNGAISLNARSSILTNAVIDLTGGAGTVNFGFTGTVFSTSNGTFSAGTSSTCVYNGGAQTLGVFTYDNLKLAGTGNKTGSTSITVNDTLTVAAAIGTLSASPTFGTNATILYDLGSANSRTASAEWPATFSGTGGVTVSTGTVTLNANKTTMSGPLTVSAGATLALSTFALGSTAGPSSVNLECGAATGSTISGTGTLTLGGNVNVNDVVSNPGTSPATISCPVALVNLSTRTFTVNSDGTKAVDLLMTGIVSTSGSIIKTGAGTMEMQNSSSSYTGSTTVNAGILRASATVAASSNGAFGSNASGLNLNGGKIESNTATFSRPITIQATNSGLDAYGTSNRTISSAITLNSAGTFNLNVGGITASNAEGQQLTLSGIISNTTGTLQLTKVSTSTVVISTVTNTYSGGTTISGGILSIDADARLGNTAGGITIDGGTLAATATFTLSSTRALTIGASGATIDVASTFNLSYGGTISGGNNVTKTSAGTLTLSSQTATINTLTIASSGGTIDAGSSTINIAGDFSIGSSATFTGNAGTVVLGGASSLITNSGTLTFKALTIASTATAATTSSSFTVAGALTVNSSGKLTASSGTITMNNGSSIVNNGGANTNLVFNNLSIAASSTVNATGSFNISGTFTTVSTSILNMGTGALSVVTVSHAGTLQTQNTSSTPITSGINWGTGTVTYNAGTGGQTIVSGTYTNLNSANTSNSNTLGGDITVSGTLTLSSGGTFSFGTTARTVTLTGTGANTLAASGAFINMNGGSNAAHLLKIAGSSIANFGTLTTGTGSTVEYNGATQTVASVTYNNLTLSGSGNVTTTSVTVNGTMSINAVIGTVSASPTYGSSAGIVYNLGNGNSRTVSNEWPASFSGSGGITISSGTSTLNADKTTAGVPITINAAATLALTTFNIGATTGPSSLTLQSGTTGASITGTGTLNLGGNVTISYSGSGSSGATISCPVALGAASTRTFTVASGTSSTDLTISGLISTSGNLLKAGAGKMILSNASSSFSGSVTINAGILSVSTIGNSAVNGNLGSGSSIVLGGGTLLFTPVAANVSTNRTIDLTTSTSNTINISDAGTTLTLNSALGGNSNPGSFIKAGAGTLTIGSSMAASGITVSAGTLNANSNTINVAGDLDASSGTFNLSSATLNFIGSGSQSFNPGTSKTIGTINVSGAGSIVSLAAATTINNLTIGSNSSFSDNGNLITGGTGSLTINGTLTLGGSSATSFPAFSGTTTIGTSSTVVYAANAGTQSISAIDYQNLTVSGSATINLPAGTVGVKGTFTPASTTSPVAGSSTIDYKGTGAQSITSFNYNNLTISSTGTRTVTLGSDVKIAGDFSPATTSTTYTVTGSTVTFNGSGNQNINNTFAFNSLTINSNASVLMNANVSTGSSGTLTLTSGNLDINGQTLTINGTSVTATGGQIVATNVSNSVMQVTTSGKLSMPFQAVNGGMNRVTVSGGGTLELVPASINNVFDIQDILTLTNSSKLELNTTANLQISGTVSMGSGASPTGYIKGNTQARMRLAGSGSGGAIGTLYFDPSTDRSSNSINEMVIASVSSGRSVILGNKLNIISLLTPLSNSNTFTFTSNGYLTLRSSSKWTACVNTVGTGTSFSGDVVVERYVNAKSVRRYVFLGPPVNGSTVRQSWQDSIFITAPGTGGAVCGSTSGNGGTTDKYNSNGYDVTTANLYTIQTYEPSGTSGTFVNFGYKADSMPLVAGKGYKVLYRGPRFKNTDGSSNCTALLNTGGSGIYADTVTLTAKGALNTGDISVTLNGKPSAANYGYTLLSNPYPAQLDFDKFYLGNTTSGMNRGFWIHDPNGSSTTGYVTTKYTSGAYHTVGRDPSSTSWTTDSSAIGYISSGQGFFVSTANTSSLGVTFKETHKVIPTIQQSGAFRSAATTSTGIRTYFYKSDSTYIDDVLVLFSDDTLINNNTYDDRFDASSLNSTNYMTSIKGGRSCAIQTRRDDYYNDTVALRVVSASTGNFYLNFKEFESMSAAGIYLLDLYLGTTTNIQSNPFYSFSVTSDAASQGANRFKIVFRSLNSVLPLSFTNIAAVQKQQGAEVSWAVGFEQNIAKYAVERSEDGRNFYTVGTVASKGNSTGAVSYSYLDTKTINNTVYYRVKSIDASGDTKNSAIVKLNSSKESLITLYPNPVRDQLTLIISNNQNFDKAKAIITNALGRTVMQQNLSGTNGNYTIDVSALSAGMYILTIINQNGDRLNEKFVKN